MAPKQVFQPLLLFQQNKYFHRTKKRALLARFCFTRLNLVGCIFLLANQ